MWRHPSELAAEERALILAEPSPRGTRALALATGTLGLLAVGLLVVTVSPRRAESPIAISATTTPITAAQTDRGPAALAPVPTTRVALRSEPARVLATPIGDGRFALITRASLVDINQTIIDVHLPSGRVSAGSIVTASDDAVIVALATIEPGRNIAAIQPDDHDMVTVMASPPIVIAYVDVDTLTVDEGTPVLDDDGELVGICSRSDDSERVRVIEVSGELDDATSVVP